MVAGFPNATQTPIPVEKLYYRFVSLGLQNPPDTEIPTNQHSNCTIFLSRQVVNQTLASGESISSIASYWNVSQQSNNISTGAESLFNGSALTVGSISVEVPTFLADVASVGIIGLYVGVVLTIGRFVRMVTSGLAPQVMFQNLEDATRLLQFCEDIQRVRNYQPFNTRDLKDMKRRVINYFGDKRWIRELNNSEMDKGEVYKLEENLYYNLIDIYKNPLKLIENTKYKKE